MTSPNEKLREEITSIIYGADWQEQDIYDAIKPDVEAVMKLISIHLNATLQEIINEIGNRPIAGTSDYCHGYSDAHRAYSKLIESKKR